MNLISKFFRFFSYAVLYTLCGAVLAAQEIVASWNLDGKNSEADNPCPPTFSSSCVYSEGLTLGTGVKEKNTSNTFGGASFAEASNPIDAATSGNFISFTISVTGNHIISFSSVAPYTISRSSTGPTSGQWQYSLNAGAFEDIGGVCDWTTTSQDAIDLSSVIALQNVPAGSSVTFRIVSWGASSSTGTWFIKDGKAALDDLKILCDVTSIATADPVPPGLSPIENQMVFCGKKLEIPLTLTSTDGDPVIATNVVSATEIEGEYAITNAVFYFTPSDTDIGTCDFTVSAADKDGTTNVTFSVTINAMPTFWENFDISSKISYAIASITGSEGEWMLDNVLVGTSSSDKRNGVKGIRARTGSAYMLFDKEHGVGSVMVCHAICGEKSSNGVSWTLSVSRDGGVSWNAYKSFPQTPPAGELETVVFPEINVAGKVRLRLDITSPTDDQTVNFDDIIATDYSAPFVFAEYANIQQFTTTQLSPSEAQTFLLSGDDLAGVVTITAPGGFEISTNGQTFASTATVTPEGGTLLPCAIYVRLVGSDTGTLDGHIEISGGVGVTCLVAVSGVVYAVAPNIAPVITATPSSMQSEADMEVQFAVAVTDEDGDVVALSVDSPDIDNSASFFVNNGATGTFVWTPPVAGNYKLHFIANDGHANGVVTQTVEIVATEPWYVPVRQGTIISQNFDEMLSAADAPLPIGWKAAAVGTVRTSSAFADAALFTAKRGGNEMSSSAQAGIYNFGAGDVDAAIDRCVGFLSSGTTCKTGNLFIRLRNTGRVAVKQFAVGYNVEKYRSGTCAKGFTVQLYVSADGGVTWESCGDNFKSVFAADEVTEGYVQAPVDTVHVAESIIEHNVEPGAELIFVWSYSVSENAETSNAQALGIDDVTIRAIADQQTFLFVR